MLKRGDVINLISPSKSFSWNDGLFVVDKINDEIVHLIKLDEDGTIQIYENGEPVITCTGINNKGINKTKLKYSFK